MNVMRVDWNPVNEEHPVSARFVQASPPQPPKGRQVEDDPAEDDEAEPMRAKVVRSPRRKGPRPSAEGVHVK